MSTEYRCENCGNQFEPDKPKRRFCSRACYLQSVRKDTSTCQNCGEEFVPRDVRYSTYCSRGCAFEDLRTWHAKEPAAPALCEICGEETNGGRFCSDECRSSIPFICEQCGEEATGYAGTKYCSYECQIRAHNPPAVEVNEYVEKTCRNCGKQFETNFMASRRKYCSERCTKRAMKRRRQARKRGQFVAPVSPYEIYERDGGTCQICGKPVDWSKEAPDPMSPTMDHIIPLSLGALMNPGMFSWHISYATRGAEITGRLSSGCLPRGKPGRISRKIFSGDRAGGAPLMAGG